MDLERSNYFRKLFWEMLKNHELLENNQGLCKIVEKGDEVDKVNMTKNQMLYLKLQGRRNFFSKKIMDALKRIDDGSFGLCLDCGEEIPLGRLEARPMTTLCIKCKEEEERVEGHIPYQKRSSTEGKTFHSDNVIELRVSGEEVMREKILKFNKARISVGLENQY